MPKPLKPRCTGRFENYRCGGRVGHAGPHHRDPLVRKQPGGDGAVISVPFDTTAACMLEGLAKALPDEEQIILNALVGAMRLRDREQIRGLVDAVIPWCEKQLDQLQGGD